MSGLIHQAKSSVGSTLSWDVPPACRAVTLPHDPWRIPKEQFTKEEKSEIWFTDGSASLAGTCWNLTAGAFQPHSGPRKSEESRPSQGAELGVVHTIHLAWKESGPERQVLTISWQHYPSERTVNYMRGGLGKRC